MKRIRQQGLRRLETWASRVLLWILGSQSRHANEAAAAKPRSILIVKSCCLGDAVLSLYALREFKRMHPDTRLEMLVSSRIEAVYRSLPEIDAVHALPITGLHLGRELLNPALWLRLTHKLRELRRKHFDWLVDLELYRSFGPVLAAYLKVSHSRGFAVPGAPEKKHTVLAYRGKADPEWKCFYGVLGLPIPESAPHPLYSPARPLPPRAKKPAAAPWHAPASQLSRPCRIGLVYGASGNWPQKKWPLESFIELGANLCHQGHELMLFGSADEKDEGEIILNALPSAQSTVGQLDFAGLIKSLAQCDLIVGNDTGTLHVAAAAGIPVITLFGPTSPAKWNALTSKALFLEALPCRPCYYLSSMPECEHRNCLRQLTPRHVTAAVLAELQTICFLSAPAETALGSFGAKIEKVV